MDKKCENCKFWKKISNIGNCRRYPPAIIKTNQLAFWPITLEADWCGEFQSKEANIDSPENEIIKETKEHENP